jgi:hypothetical protein
MADADVERSWKLLLQAIRAGEIVPVVGPDLLVTRTPHGTGLLYDYFARELATRLEVPVQSPSPTLNEVACAYIEERSSEELRDVHTTLKAIIAEGGYDVPQSLLKLAEIEPLRLFLTTTFDLLLEEALDRVRHPDGERRTVCLAHTVASKHHDSDLPDSPVMTREPVPSMVFHLFGVPVPFNDYAVTDEGMLEFTHSLQSGPKSPARLLDFLDTKQLLMIGSSFPDWLARFFIRAAKRERMWLAKNRGDFLAETTPRLHPSFDAFLRSFGPGMKTFPDAPVAFVDELHRRWKAASPGREGAAAAPAAVSIPPMPPGAIFISYASEDAAIARTITERLKSQKLDVWLDEERLRGGERFGETIFRYIDESTLFLPVISRRSASAPGVRFFRGEWTHAIDQIARRLPNLPFIMPIRVDDTPIDDQRLPNAFRTVKWIEAPGGNLSDEQVDSIRRDFRKHEALKAPAR